MSSTLEVSFDPDRITPDCSLDQSYDPDNMTVGQIEAYSNEGARAAQDQRIKKLSGSMLSDEVFEKLRELELAREGSSAEFAAVTLAGTEISLPERLVYITEAIAQIAERLAHLIQTNEQIAERLAHLIQTNEQIGERLEHITEANEQIGERLEQLMKKQSKPLLQTDSLEASARGASGGGGGLPSSEKVSKKDQTGEENTPVKAKKRSYKGIIICVVFVAACILTCVNWRSIKANLKALRIKLSH